MSSVFVGPEVEFVNVDNHRIDAPTVEADRLARHLEWQRLMQAAVASAREENRRLDTAIDGRMPLPCSQSVPAVQDQCRFEQPLCIGGLVLRCAGPVLSSRRHLNSDPLSRSVVKAMQVDEFDVVT